MSGRDLGSRRTRLIVQLAGRLDEKWCGEERTGIVDKGCFHIVLMKSLRLFGMIAFVVCPLNVISGLQQLDSVGQALLNGGNLTAAKEIFVSISTNKAVSAEQRAVAFKNLATAKFRLGDESYRADFDKSDALFKSIAPLGCKEHGKMLYQKANCLLAAFENEMVNNRLQGLPKVPFSLVRDYLHPATKCLEHSEMLQAELESCDFDLLKTDIALAEARLWFTYGQTNSAVAAYRKVLDVTAGALARTETPPDTRKKMLLRRATTMLEWPIDNATSLSTDDALDYLKKAEKIDSGNKELDFAVQTFYLKTMLRHSIKRHLPLSDEFEKMSLSLADGVEELGCQMAEGMDYLAQKSYFSMRTAAYEVLVEYFAYKDRPFDMLLAMNKMRSRALQSAINQNGKQLDEHQLRGWLSERNAMLVAYFVGVDSVWMVGFTKNGGEIARSIKTGVEVVSMCKNVVRTISQVGPLMVYCRFGANKAIEESYSFSNDLYNELFKRWHEKYKADKLERIYLMPNHYLNYLPFGALVVRQGEGSIFKTRYVAHEGIPICYSVTLPSISANEKPEFEFNRNIVLSRSDYSNAAYYYDNAERNPDLPKGSVLNLPGAAEEGRHVAKLLSVAQEDFLVDDDASEFNLLSRVKDGAGVVHIASHAHLVKENPLKSYVVFREGGGEDGKVTVDELVSRYRGKIKAGLLVLSACNTNRGEDNIKPGDDIAALSNAFLVSGARNVVATQWPASDDSFPLIMSLFYNEVMKKTPSDKALAKALQTYLEEKKDTIMNYPVFWGNIVSIVGGQ